MVDRLTSMGVFVKAVELGSFTAAGTVLGLSSQMVGKHVQALETRLGTALLRRSTRKQSLTDAGQAYYERCRAVLAEAEAADAVVEDLSTTPRGALRVSAPIGFGASRLAPFLTAFMLRHPAVQVELVLSDRYVDPIEEGYDAVVRLGPIADTSLAARELASHAQTCCAAPHYLAAHGTPRTPDDLARHTCLGFINASGLPYADWRFTKDGVTHAVRVQSRFRVNDGRVLAAAAAAGCGIILQPEAVLREPLEAGTLVPVLADYAAPSRPMLVLFSARRPQPAKLRALIDGLAAAFPKHPDV